MSTDGWINLLYVIVAAGSLLLAITVDRLVDLEKRVDQITAEAKP